MKNLLLVITIVSFFAACRSKPEAALEIKKEMPPVENAYNSSILTDVGTITDDFVQPEKKAAPVRRATPIKKKSGTTNPAPKVEGNTVQNIPETKPSAPVVNDVPTTNPEPANTESTNTGTGSTTNSGPAVESAIPAPKKKGWSDAAKGAVIGAVGGAIAGAVINGKNRGKGAVIGGVIGAAGGYIFGRKKDKQSGRVDYALQ